MCKVLFIAGIKPQHLPKVHQLAKAAAKNMSIVEDDGVGYAAITRDGMIYGEKWLNKEDAFTVHGQAPVDPSIGLMTALFGGMADWQKPPPTLQTYEAFGQRTAQAVENTVGLILHARKATNGAKVISNVHPFHVLDTENQPDTALIHNGSIVNHAKLTKKTSTCDSEVILHEYIENMMFHNPWGVEQLAKTLIGEYAVGVLTSMLDESGVATPVLDVFKSGKELFAAYVPELETVVFCTMEHTLVNSCTEAGLTTKHVVKIKDGNLIRINCLTGERVDELATFAVSGKFDNTNYNNHVVRHSPMQDVTMESCKASFARKHPSIFTVPYVEVTQKLEENEIALFSELAASNKTNHKALHLVSVALNSVVGKV